MWLSLIALGLVPLGAAAQECGSSTSVNSESEKITSQEDLDALQSDCTILLSHYSVTPEFTGPFILPNIVNLSTLSGGSDSSPGSFDVPSFEMPDLEYATSLFLHEMDSLESFSVPKLTSIGWASIHIPSDIDLLEMSALEESGTLSLVGHFTDVSFPALHTVAAGDVVILNSSPADKTETRMNISFPALNSSDSIYISGRTSHVSLPELTRLASPWMQGSGTNFSLWGETIDFDLPKLHTVDGSIYFEGNMTSLSLPSLDRVDQNLTITAGNPLSIDIPELRYAEVIHLTGKIKSVELPALIEYSDLHVDTDLELDCNAFMGEFDTAPGQKNVTCVSRGAVEDSDATDETTEESTTQDDERGDEETGNDNGSASLHVRGVGAMVAISILFVGLGGLWN